MILLLNKGTQKFIKKILLLNFFFICLINWSNYFLNIQGIEILINTYISNNSYYEFDKVNILNIFYLYFFEILYYLWSFITYQNNLSDWSIPYPKKSDLLPISKITIFYLGVLSYYFIFNRIS